MHQALNLALIKKLDTYLKTVATRPCRMVGNEYLVLNGMERLDNFIAICFWVRDNTTERITVKWKHRSMTFENGRRVE